MVINLCMYMLIDLIFLAREVVRTNLRIVLLFHTNFHIFVTTIIYGVFFNQMWTSVQVTKRTNVTQMLCVRTLKGRTFVDAKKDMLEMVKTAQVKKTFMISKYLARE